MGQGSVTKGLIIASKTAGWDPTKIEGSSIEGADTEALNIFVRQASNGAMTDSFPEDHPGIDINATPFQTGLGGKPTPSTKTSGANPFPGKPGA
jgi:hypothetical protein